MLDKAENIGRGSAAAVDYESRVLLTDLRAADADTLESALFNECARKMTLGALECAARAGIFKRLLIPAAGNDIVHGIFYLLRVAGNQANGGGGYDKTAVLICAVAIRELHSLIVKLAGSSVGRNIFAVYEHILHLAAVSSCVHEHRAADGSGYAIGKLETRERIFERKGAKLSEARAALGANGVFIGQGYPALLAGEYNGALYALVADEDIAALTEDEHRDILFFAETNKLGGLPGVLGREEQLSGAADFKARIIFH